jgi:hypothetical protein
MTSQLDHSPNTDATLPMIVMQGVEKWFGSFHINGCVEHILSSGAPR